MSKRHTAPVPRPRKRWPLVIVGLLVALFILGGVGFVGALALEERDSFCASCHTVPETTYVDRATTVMANANATIPDLATMHYHLTQQKNQDFSCIDCHHGDATLGQRIQTLALGGRDVLIYASGKGDPSIEKTQIYQPNLPNDACISCHTQTLLTMKGTDSHFHNFLPQTAALVASGKQLITSSTGGRRFGRLRTVDTSVTCTSCHLAHKTVDNSDPSLMMVDPNYAQQACNTCHQDAGVRGEGFDPLLLWNR